MMRHAPVRLIPSLLAFGLLVGLAGCQTGLPGADTSGSGAVTANAVAGDAIEVTALDDPAPAEPPAEVQPAKGADRAPVQATAPGASAAEAEDPAATPQPTPAPKAEITETPDVPKTDQQLACEKRKGRWVPVGASKSFYGCTFPTRDSGKTCKRESDCEGVCLARSGTCSPYKPLYGCNEILQDNGARVTLCIE